MVRLAVIPPVKSAWVRSFRPQKSFIWRQKLDLEYHFASRTLSNSPTLDVIVSLTSFPKRLKHLHLVVKSLLINAAPPKKIVLYLDASEMAGHALPGSLSNLQGDVFEIRFVPHGFRSFSKLVHALVDFPDQNILTVDDDYLYDRQFLRHFQPYLHRNDVKVISGNGRIMSTESGTAYRDWRLQMSGRSRHGMVLGYTGVLYKPKALSPLVLDTSLFQDLCPHNDDVWFTCCAYLNGIAEIHFAGVPTNRNKEIHFPNSPRLMDQNLHGRLEQELHNVIHRFSLTGFF